MKAKVVLTHTVTLFVEGDSEDSIADWLSQTTPGEARKLAREQTGTYVDEAYDERIDCFVEENSVVDYRIK